MGVQGAQRARLGLHAGGRGVPAAAEGRQYVHGVVAGVEEHPAPQVGDPVRVSLGDSDEAAARPDAAELLLAHPVPDLAGQDRQHREGEQGLEGAGRGQFAVRVRRGEHLTRLRVGDQPGQCRDVGDLGGAPVGSDLRPGAVEHGRPGRRHLGAGRPTGSPRRSGVRAGRVGGRGGAEGEDARHTERARRRNGPGRESDRHTINVGMNPAFPALPVPDTGARAPGCRTPRPMRRAGSAGCGAETRCCPASRASAPGASPGSPGRPGSAGPGADRVRRSTRRGSRGVPRAGCRSR